MSLVSHVSVIAIQSGEQLAVRARSSSSLLGRDLAFNSKIEGREGLVKITLENFATILLSVIGHYKLQHPRLGPFASLIQSANRIALFVAI